MAGVARIDEGKCRQLYLNYNKIIFLNVLVKKGKTKKRVMARC